MASGYLNDAAGTGSLKLHLQCLNSYSIIKFFDKKEATLEESSVKPWVTEFGFQVVLLINSEFVELALKYIYIGQNSHHNK